MRKFYIEAFWILVCLGLATALGFAAGYHAHNPEVQLIPVMVPK